MSPATAPSRAPSTLAWGARSPKPRTDTRCRRRVPARRAAVPLHTAAVEARPGTRITSGPSPRVCTTIRRETKAWRGRAAAGAAARARAPLSRCRRLGMPPPASQAARWFRIAARRWRRRSGLGGPQAGGHGRLLHLAFAAGGDDAVDAGLLGAEGGQFGSGQNRSLLGADARRIDALAATPDFVVQVRPGGGARRADVGDDLTLPHALAGPNARGVARQVAIAAFQPVRVANAQPVAVAAPAPRLDHHPIGGGDDRGARPGGEVGALVHLAIAGDRVPAIAEVRRDAGEPLQRSPHEGRPGVLARGVEVLDLVGTRPLEPVEGHALQFGVEQLAGFDGAAALSHGAVEDVAELVAGADVPLQVELVREQSGGRGGD